MPRVCYENIRGVAITSFSAFKSSETGGGLQQCNFVFLRLCRYLNVWRQLLGTLRFRFFLFRPHEVFMRGLVFDKLNEAIFHHEMCFSCSSAKRLKDKFWNFRAFVIGTCSQRLDLLFRVRKGFLCMRSCFLCLWYFKFLSFFSILIMECQVQNLLVFD